MEMRMLFQPWLIRYSYCLATTGLSENQRDDALWKHDVTIVSNKPFVVFHSTSKMFLRVHMWFTREFQVGFLIVCFGWLSVVQLQVLASSNYEPKFHLVKAILEPHWLHVSNLGLWPGAFLLAVCWVSLMPPLQMETTLVPIYCCSLIVQYNQWNGYCLHLSSESFLEGLWSISIQHIGCIQWLGKIWG
jgi:membrane-bound acyltransferase YfiQ involved in biofilm formation